MKNSLLPEKADHKGLVERMLQHYAAPNGEYKYLEYVGIIRWYLQKKRRQYENCQVAEKPSGTYFGYEFEYYRKPVLVTLW